MCNVQYYDALIDFTGHYLKRDRHNYTKWGWKKNDTGLHLYCMNIYLASWWIFSQAVNTPLMNEINLLVITIINIIIIIIIINIYSGSIYKNNGSSPYTNLKKVQKNKDS